MELDGMKKPADEIVSVRLRLICREPPVTSAARSPMLFGLQDKRQVIDIGEQQADGSIAYNCIVQVRRQPPADLRFTGRYVQGPANDPFLYLSLGEAAQPVPWIKRLKITLTPITWAQVIAVGTLDQGWIEASVDGQGSARVPLLGNGWTVQTEV